MIFFVDSLIKLSLLFRPTIEDSKDTLNGENS